MPINDVQILSWGPEQTGAPPGAENINHDLVGPEYLKQFPKEMQAAIENRVNGLSTPTGNPRKGFTQAVNLYAAKYGQDIGMPVDDTSFSARRTMRNDLAKTSLGSLGGQVNFGNTAIQHLHDLSKKAIALDNYDLGIAPVSEAVNWVRGLTSAQAAKMDALKADAQHYGQEITKFYAGSPGGEAERTRFLSAIGATKSPQQLAAVIEAESELIHGRMKQLDTQIGGLLGPKGTQDYPAIRADSRTALAGISANVARLRGAPVAPSDVPTTASAPQPSAPPQPPAAPAMPMQIGPDGWLDLGSGVRIREKK